MMKPAFIDVPSEKNKNQSFVVVVGEWKLSKGVWFTSPPQPLLFQWADHLPFPRSPKQRNNPSCCTAPATKPAPPPPHTNRREWTLSSMKWKQRALSWLFFFLSGNFTLFFPFPLSLFPFSPSLLLPPTNTALDFPTYFNVFFNLPKSFGASRSTQQSIGSDLAFLRSHPFLPNSHTKKLNKNTQKTESKKKSFFILCPVLLSMLLASYLLRVSQSHRNWDLKSSDSWDKVPSHQKQFFPFWKKLTKNHIKSSNYHFLSFVVAMQSIASFHWNHFV